MFTCDRVELMNMEAHDLLIILTDNIFIVFFLIILTVICAVNIINIIPSYCFEFNFT